MIQIIKRYDPQVFLDTSYALLESDLTWLGRQIKQRGIHSSKDVLLAVCDGNVKLVIYGRDNKKHAVRQVKWPQQISVPH